MAVSRVAILFAVALTIIIAGRFMVIWPTKNMSRVVVRVSDLVFGSESNVVVPAAAVASTTSSSTAIRPKREDFLYAGDLVRSDGPIDRDGSTGREYVKWIWKSDNPQWRWFDINQVRQCLKDTSVLAIGDSHTRNMFHDIGIMLGFNSTYLLPAFEELQQYGKAEIQPNSVQQFERQGAIVGIDRAMQNPCGYYDHRSIEMDHVEVGKWSFLSGSCCLGRRGHKWLQNLSATLAKFPDVIYYGSAMFWDIRSYFMTEDDECKKPNDTLVEFLVHGLVHALTALGSYTQSLRTDPVLLFKSSWGPLQIHGLEVQKVINEVEHPILSKMLPEARPLNFHTLFAAFGKSQLVYGDVHGHPLPDVQRSITMVFLNLICPRSEL